MNVASKMSLFIVVCLTFSWFNLQEFHTSVLVAGNKTNEKFMGSSNVTPTKNLEIDSKTTLLVHNNETLLDNQDEDQHQDIITTTTTQQQQQDDNLILAPFRSLGKKHGGNYFDFPGLGGYGHKKHKHHHEMPMYPPPTPPPAPIQPVPYPVPLPVPVPPRSPPPLQRDGPAGGRPKTTQPKYIKRETVVTTEAELTCPDGFIFDKGTCRKYDQKASKLGCLEGWTYENGSCVGADIVLPDYSCDGGYEKQGNQCVLLKQAPRQVLCPTNFMLEGTQCIRDVHTPPDMKCPDGYRFLGNNCVKSQTAPTSTRCPDGYNNDGGICKRSVYKPGSLLCPNGFAMDQTNGKCSRQSSVSAIPNCPVGYEYLGNVCVARKTCKAQPTCHKGSIEHNGTTCVSHKRTEIIYECPKGYRMVHSGGGKPSGGALHTILTKTAMCEITHEVPVDFSCQSGSMKYDGKLKKCHGKKHQHTEPLAICPPGYAQHASRDSCVKTDTASPIPSCPDLYTLDFSGDECTMTQSTLPQYHCPPGYRPIGDGKICETEDTCPVKYGCPGPNFTYNAHANVCEELIIEKAIVECPPQYQAHHDGRCHRIEAVESKQICPPGFSLIDEETFYLQQAQLESVSSSSMSMSPPMSPPMSPMSIPTLRAASSKSQNTQNTHHHTPRGRYQTPTLIPSNGGAGRIMSKTPMSGEEQIIDDPTAAERKGGLFDWAKSKSKKRVFGRSLFEKNFRVLGGGRGGDHGGGHHSKGKHHHHHSDMPTHTLPSPSRLICVGEAITEFQHVCPPGYTYTTIPNGTGKNTQSQNACVTREVTPPHYECPINFQEENLKCIAKEFTSIRPMCPIGYQISGKQCVTHIKEKPVVMCPVGYKLYEGICVKQLNAEPIPICPVGYNYDSLVGKCFNIIVNYDFANEGPAPKHEEAQLPLQEEPTEEALLDLEETTTTTPFPREAIAPLQAAPMPAPQPTIVQVVTQPVPMPAPVVYLPRQAPPPPPMPAPQPIPQPIPVPMPFPVEMPPPAPIIRERPVPVPVAKHETILAMPVGGHHKLKHKKKRHHHGF